MLGLTRVTSKGTWAPLGLWPRALCAKERKRRGSQSPFLTVVVWEKRRDWIRVSSRDDSDFNGDTDGLGEAGTRCYWLQMNIGATIACVGEDGCSKEDRQ